MNLFQLNESHVGKSVSFGYHGKLRKGRVDGVGNGWFRLNVETPLGNPNEEGRRYSSFRYNELQSPITVH